MNKKHFLPLASLLIALFCAGAAAAQSKAELLKRYRQAVKTAARATGAKMVSDLIAVTPQNEDLIWNEDRTKVLVVTWKSQSSYDNYIKPYTQTSSSEANVIWVTMAPYLHDFCHRYVARGRRVKDKALEIRLKQRLGLNPAWQYDVFVQLWVSPADLFRPCVDPEITDSMCELNFGTAIPVVKDIADYPAFYKNIYFSDYRFAPGVPWTGLGYTCDWFKRRHRVGESEFIIAPSSPYEIFAATPTREYCEE